MNDIENVLREINEKMIDEKESGKALKDLYQRDLIEMKPTAEGDAYYISDRVFPLVMNAVKVAFMIDDPRIVNDMNSLRESAIMLAILKTGPVKSESAIDRLSVMVEIINEMGHFEEIFSNIK